MKSVKLLQVLAQHYNHLHEQPHKALVDILSEVRLAGCGTPGGTSGCRNMEKT